jgi:hypothetical protein
LVRREIVGAVNPALVAVLEVLAPLDCLCTESMRCGGVIAQGHHLVELIHVVEVKKRFASELFNILGIPGAVNFKFI